MRIIRRDSSFREELTVGKRISEEENMQLRNLLEKVSMENSRPQSLPTANGKLRRLFYEGEEHV